MTVVAIGLTFAAALTHGLARHIASLSRAIVHPEFVYIAAAGGLAVLSGVIFAAALVCWVVAI